MLTKKKDATEVLAHYKTMLDKIIGKECTIKFDMHESDGFIVEGIEVITLQKVKNKPNKQEFEGKMKSPMMFQILNNQAPLIFTFDDSVMTQLTNGVRITVELEKPLNDKHKIEVDIRLS